MVVPDAAGKDGSEDERGGVMSSEDDDAGRVSVCAEIGDAGGKEKRDESGLESSRYIKSPADSTMYRSK